MADDVGRMSGTEGPCVEALRTQLTELNVRSRTYTTQIWQVPFAYIGILGVVVAQMADRAKNVPGFLALALGFAAVVGIAGVFHSKRAVGHIQEIETALRLTPTVKHKPVRYVGPIFVILALSIGTCIWGSGYFACLKFANQHASSVESASSEVKRRQP